MDRPIHRSGLDRARWLADLAEALEGARAILAALSDSPLKNDSAAIADRIVRAISEVEALRRGANWPVGTAFDPDWSKFRGSRPEQHF